MTAIGSTPALEARDVSFSYRAPVVRGLSLGLKAGEMTGIIGPNGCGKTTVLRLLAGLLKPASGVVLWQGATSLAEMPRKEIARRIALVPQNGGDGAQLTVLQFALQGRSPHLSLFGFETARDEAVAMAALEMTQLARHCDARVGELSGGEKQRLMLARALVQESQILLIDELTANLDINYQVELLRLTRRLTQERGLATLVVSHEIYLLSSFCDCIALMAGGAIQSLGASADVMTQENLKGLFGLDFLVRPASDGPLEILPVLKDRSST
jgi:iron complex transport system ATP-binding protein